MTARSQPSPDPEVEAMDDRSLTVSAPPSVTMGHTHPAAEMSRVLQTGSAAGSQSSLRAQGCAAMSPGSTDMPDTAFRTDTDSEH
jgi:hypothetical protein